MKRILSIILASLMLLILMPVIPSAEDALAGKTIIAFGDSLTQGTVWWVQSGLDTYPDILKRNFPNSEVINAGSRGDSTYNATLRFETDVLSKNPDIVIICFGMNDQAWEVKYNRPIQTLERYRKQLVDMVVALQEIGADVIFMTPNPVYEEAYSPNSNNNYEYGLMGDYCNEMREIALEYGCGLIDMNYEITLRGISTYVSSDGIHQTVEGHKLYAECVTNYLNAVYNGINRATVTVNYKNENGNLLSAYNYVGAAGANVTLATPSHLGCETLSEDINTTLVDGASHNMLFEDEIIVSRNKNYTTTAPNRGDSFDDDAVRLTDGQKGIQDPGTYFYSGWNKTSTGYVEVTVDLREETKTNVYRIYAGAGHWGIMAPTKISIAVSDDAISFSDEIAVSTTLEKYCDGKVVDGSATTMYTLTATAEYTQNARYVRFRITPSAGNAFLWIDEVEAIYNASASEEKPVEPPAPEYTLGDVNGDEKIDQYDYILVKRHYFSTRTLSEAEMLPADVNNDERVDQYDYILIRRHYFGTYKIG